MTLDEFKLKIAHEARYVGKKPFSHNIVSLLLNEVAKTFGKDEANNIIRECKLERKGWKEQP